MAHILSVLCFIALTASDVISIDSPLVMSLDSLPHTQTKDFWDERTIDLGSSKQLDQDQEIKFKSSIKRKHADRIKHPFLITKDDIDTDAIVEDNIIVESNVLHLVKSEKSIKNEILRVKRFDHDESLVPHKRVTRGWNLQHVIVPDYPYYNVPQREPKTATRKWITGDIRRNKEWSEESPKAFRNYYRGWGAGAQHLQTWPTKLYG